MSEPKDLSCTTADAGARIEVLCVDLNGIARGKWEPLEELNRVMAGKIRLPISTAVLNIWGSDAVAGFGQAAGDPDGACLPDARTLVPIPWANGQQVLATLSPLERAPGWVDPRGILSRVLARFSARGWTPVVACELEFYLLDESARQTLVFQAPAALRVGTDGGRRQLYDLATMDAMDGVLATIRAYAKVQELPLDSLLAEMGPGQFETNLLHRADALAAADDAFCLKRLVVHAAAKHGMIGTFMAKPYGDKAGSGMHLHVSVVDRDGANVLDATQDATLLEAAVAGVLENLLAAQAIFAPHANSYRRFQPSSFAPVSCNWGRDNRGAAVRVPEWHGPNTRLECRVAGADVNPYLLVATLLGCILRGMEKRLTPPPAIEDVAYNPASVPQLTHDWLTAIERFAASEVMGDILGTAYRDLFARVKRDEASKLQAMVTDIDRQTYLGRL